MSTEARNFYSRMEGRATKARVQVSEEGGRRRRRRLSLLAKIEEDPLNTQHVQHRSGQATDR